MKILWFANTPCGATEKLTGKPVTSGGWLYSLAEQVKVVPDVELHIAFYWGGNIESFEYNGIVYHPIYFRGEDSKIGRLLNRLITAYGSRLDDITIPRLENVIRAVKPDIIHVHGSEGNFGLIAEKLLPCPIVMSIQGILSPTIHLYYRGYSKNEIRAHESLLTKLTLGGISINEKIFRKNSEREKKIYKLIPNIIGRTFWDKSGSLALNPQRNYYEVGEIMRPEFYKARWDKASFGIPFIVTTTISVGYYKGLETVYQAAKVLVEAGFHYQWNVIGVSKDDSIALLSERKVGCSAEKLNIHLLGRKNSCEMVSLMRGADLFVQVSHIENSPNSLGEAMLLGMPIIATFAGGTASMLADNVEGRLLQDGEPYSMAGMIMEMSADFSKAKSMADSAYETAHHRHNPEHVCSQLLLAYKTILSNNV